MASRLVPSFPKNTTMQKTILFFVFAFFCLFTDVHGACGGTVRTWAGTNTNWAIASNWSPANVPDTAVEDVVMVSTSSGANFNNNYSLGCVDVFSGVINSTANAVMTITGDYFKAPYQNTLNLTHNSFTIAMAGTAAQTFEAIDDLRSFTISNTTSVTLKNDFRVRNTMTLPSSGTLYVEGILRLSNALIIPSGYTVVIKSGGAIYSDMNITVNGTLQINGGGELRMASGRVLSVPVGGIVKAIGSAGNPSRILSTDSSSRFTFTVAGSLSANYMVVSRATGGVNVTGTILQMNNSEFRAMTTSSYGLVLGSTAVVPATWVNIGFYNDDAVATPKNINATAYNSTAITISPFTGDVSGATFEVDPNNKLNWGASASTELQIINDAETGEPSVTMNASSTLTFAEFAFVLNQADVATNITNLIITMTGTAAISDLTTVRAYRDAATSKNCDYNVGTDLQIGSNLAFSGSPPKATLSIPTGDLVTSSTSINQACVHIVATSSASPSDQKTVAFSIVSASDVTNSQNYPMSATSGTPINGRYTTLVGTGDVVWNGTTSTAWNTASNWSTFSVPTTTRNCQVGLGTRSTLVNVNPIVCSNAYLTTGGVLDFANNAFSFNIYNGLTVSSGYTFSNAANATIAMTGSSNQVISLGTAFPGNLTINNTGVAGNNQVDLAVDATINGNLTCTAGVLNIGSGLTMTVLGNVTVQTGCTLNINPGGTLKLGNGRTLTVNSGGILKMVGTSALKAIVTSNTGSAAYNVVVNGTINARYYSFDHLNTGGISIEAGATIDAINFMQDGSFSYPVNNGSTLLYLKRQIPGNTLSNMTFDLASSTATGTVNINTTGAAAGTLSITSYSGNLAGAGNHVQPLYLISWSGLSNTISITQESTSPATVTAGNTSVIMGRFGFKQDNAGASFVNSNITSLNVTLHGTGTGTDIASARLYSDPSCTGSGGTLVSSGTFSGNPAKVNFSIASGNLVVPANTTATVKVCAYVEYDISSSATGGNTVGVRLASAADFVNSAAFTVSTAFPVTLGTASTISVPTSSTWTGAISTAWNTAGNWSNSIVPTSTINCVIPNVARDPVISTASPACKSVDIQGGVLTINAGASLDVYADYTNTGTLTNSGTLTIRDSGSNNHYITSTPAIASLNLAAAGYVFINNANTVITNLGTMSSTSNLAIPNGMKLTLPNGYTISAGTIRVEGGGTLEIGNAKTLAVAGGRFQIAGTNDSFPQNSATKGFLNASGSGANTFSFTATAGVVDLLGFHIARLDTNGLNLGGTTTLTNLSGGQFTNLSTAYASVKVVQLNNSGTLPASSTNVAWNWGNFNVFTGTNPTSAQAYKLVSSTGCANHSIDFSGWTGDWYESQPNFDVSTKVSAVNCTITMSGSASAVSLLSFQAIPYNAKVDVRWETNVERSHLGFNIYRTTDGSSRFQQVNKELIRNLKTSTSNRGSYRFIDNDVVNDRNYYYYLEDVDINGRTTMHGPVFATPMAILGTPPLDGISENSGENSPTTPQTGTPPTIKNPTYQDLGNGIVILGQTSTSLRIEITPPAVVYSPSSWNASYEQTAMSGYSKMSLPGRPELPEKDLLIEVHEFATTAEVNKTVLTTALVSGHNIAPAPDFVMGAGGVLTPSYALNSSVYNSNAFYPAQTYPKEFYSIENNLVAINGKKFLKLKINPLRFNPVTQEIKSASKIVLDIGLNGDDWDVTPPDVNSQISPYSTANTLRIDYQKAGMYQIDYSDFADSQVDGPFAGSDVNLWRLYFQDKEIPLEIDSANGAFSAGDSIRFYLPYKSSTETKDNQVILSPVNLISGAASPKRIETVNADPAGQIVSADVLTTLTKTYEQNNVFVDAFSIGDELDHYFYQSLYSAAGGDTFTLSASLPELDPSNPENVIIKIHALGMMGVLNAPVKHHMHLSVGGQFQGEAVFEENNRTVLTFFVSADSFVAGTNTISVKLPGTFAAAGDYDRVLIDKVEIIYRGTHAGAGGVATVSIADQLQVHSLDRFPSAQIVGYDLTDELNPLRMENLVIASDGSGAFGVSFFIDNVLNENNEKVLSFIEGNRFLKPSALSLNPGIRESLRSSANEADLIILGEESLLAAAEELSDRRRAQGLDVMMITPESIYSEFSHGRISSKAVRDFISTARTNWRKAPRYLLLLGDATNDPLDHLQNGIVKGTNPAPFINGRFMDFSGDNYFVSSQSSHLPSLSVGRIPTNDVDKIRAYIEKIKLYEEGTAAPSAHLKEMAFFADQDTAEYEHFNQMASSMMSAARGFTNTLYDRTLLGSGAATRAKMIDEFNRGPLLVSLVGHGANDRFGSDILLNNHVQSLNNTLYPIVVTWNCESAFFYSSDTTTRSLGEELLLKAEGGAIAYLGSTTQTTPPAQLKLAQNFFEQLTAATNKPWDGVRLGDLLFRAKTATGNGSYEKDIINSFVILGDPSLQLPSGLFPQSPYVTPPAPKKNFFGCKANAAEGDTAEEWWFGLSEFLFYVMAMYLCSKWVRHV